MDRTLLDPDRYRLLMESVQDFAVFELDSDGCVSRWTAEAERLLGWRADEMVGRHFSGLFCNDDVCRGEPERELRAAEADGRCRDQIRVIKKDGTGFWAEKALTPVHDEAGRLRGFVNVIHDVTARRQAATEVAEVAEAARNTMDALALLDALLAASPVGVAFLDRDLRYVRINGALAAMTGLPPEGFVGRTLQDINPTAAAWVDPIKRRVLETGEPVTGLEFPAVANSSCRRHCLANYYPVRDTEGRTIGVGVAVLDITERKRAEDGRQFLIEAGRALAGSLDYRESLRNAAALAVPRLADSCIIELVGKDGAVEEAAAVHADSTKARLAREAAGRCDLPPDCRYGLWRVMRSGRPEVFPEIPAPEPPPGPSDGAAPAQTFGPVAGLCVPLPAQGRILGAASFLSFDPHRRFSPAEVSVAEEFGRQAGMTIGNAMLYAEAQEAVRLRDEFISVASHELRTPLSALQLQIYALKQTAKGDAAVKLSQEETIETLDSAEQQVRRLTRLIGNLLDATRINAGKLVLSPERIDLAALLGDAAAQLAEAFKQTGCTLELKAEGPVIGRWDRSRIEQVVTNLLSNAAKYGRGRPVEAEVSSAGGRARLTVRDRGIGIPAENLPTIFDQFERAVSEKKYSGLGLGLYITRRIVEAHGGTISVQSAPDVGSTFTVELPLQAA